MRGWIIGGYFLLVNLVTFVLRGVDKRRAVKEQRRIPEKKLYRFSLLGGIIGAFAGMEVFRHKRLKGKFLWKWFLIVLMWLVILGGFAYFFYLK